MCFIPTTLNSSNFATELKMWRMNIFDAIYGLQRYGIKTKIAATVARNKYVGNKCK